ncbi:MAG: hypothetical protein ACYDHE_11325 [Candidatus Acidiferrales bacterium]
MGGNGDNGLKPIEIDVTNEHSFKTGVIQTLQMISDNTACLPSLKKKVEHHEQIVKTGKWLVIPLMALLHAGLKSIFNRLGW